MPSIQLTLTTTPASILTALRAIDSTVPGEAREVLVSSDLSNAAGSLISIGDSNIGANRYGYQLEPGDSRSYEGGAVRIGQFYAVASDDGLLLNVEVVL